LRVIVYDRSLACTVFTISLQSLRLFLPLLLFFAGHPSPVPSHIFYLRSLVIRETVFEFASCEVRTYECLLLLPGSMSAASSSVWRKLDGIQCKFINCGFLQKVLVSLTVPSKSEIYFLLPNILSLTTTTSILSSSFSNYLPVMVYDRSWACTVFTLSLQSLRLFFEIYYFLPGSLEQYSHSYSDSALLESEILCSYLLPFEVRTYEYLLFLPGCKSAASYTVWRKFDGPQCNINKPLIP
jgi:hypothetical protein